MDSVEHPAAQLTKRRIGRDNTDQISHQKSIIENCNPFDGPISESSSLHHIAPGRTASKKTENYL